jgi:hypothetical protein
MPGSAAVAAVPATILKKLLRLMSHYQLPGREFLLVSHCILVSSLSSMEIYFTAILKRKQAGQER